MIFNQFDQADIVAGRTSKVASGFWPGGDTFWSASSLINDFFDLTQSAATPSPSYGASIYDLRRTMYYTNVFPDTDYHTNNDPYFSVAYGSWAGELGSGSFNLDTASILAFPTKTIYTQYKNLLLGTADVDGKFSFKSGSSSTNGDDIFVLNFSSYKMKDRIDEGIFEITLTGSNGQFTFRDDSPFLTQTSNTYNLITGSINDASTTLPAYQGIGLLYPADGVVVFNATVINQLVGLTNISGTVGVSGFSCPANYNANCIAGITITPPGTVVPTTANHAAFFWSLQNTNVSMKVRKTELVPARHYFVRVKNRDFNYSNNPTYVYDGTEDNIHAKGTIRNEDFISDPRTYVTSVGLYNNNNELVAVAKLSRPALKSFDNELLIKVRLDF
jgi:hypothetical protein